MMRCLLLFLALFSIFGNDQRLFRVRALRQSVCVDFVPTHFLPESSALAANLRSDRATIDACNDLAEKHVYQFRLSIIGNLPQIRNLKNIPNLSIPAEGTIDLAEAILNHRNAPVCRRIQPTHYLSHEHNVVSARARRQGPSVLSNPEKSANNKNSIGRLGLI